MQSHCKTVLNALHPRPIPPGKRCIFSLSGFVRKQTLRASNICGKVTYGYLSTNFNNIHNTLTPHVLSRCVHLHSHCSSDLVASVLVIKTRQYQKGKRWFRSTWGIFNKFDEIWNSFYYMLITFCCNMQFKKWQYCLTAWSYWSLLSLNKRHPWYERKCSFSWGLLVCGSLPTVMPMGATLVFRARMVNLSNTIFYKERVGMVWVWIMNRESF